MAKLQILSRWVGPPHSPIECFRAEGTQVDYVLYGTSSGRVVLQQFQVRMKAATVLLPLFLCVPS